jgi:integrase
LLVANPALDWETPEPVKSKRKAYSAAEVTKLETGVHEWLRPILVTLAWTGMRIDELINLRWKDVDFDHQVIRVRVQEE